MTPENDSSSGGESITSRLASNAVYVYWRAKITLVHWLYDPYLDAEIIANAQDKMLTAARKWNW